MFTQYYTKIISEEVAKALREVNFPFPIADMGFAVPQIVEISVDYASVLDWLADKDLFIIFNKIEESNTFWAYNRKKATDIRAINLDFYKALDKVILLAIEFLKSEQNDA